MSQLQQIQSARLPVAMKAVFARPSKELKSNGDGERETEVRNYVEALLAASQPGPAAIVASAYLAEREFPEWIVLGVGPAETIKPSAFVPSEWLAGVVVAMKKELGERDARLPRARAVEPVWLTRVASHDPHVPFEPCEAVAVTGYVRGAPLYLSQRRTVPVKMRVIQ